MPRAKQRTPELRDRVLKIAVETLADDGVAGFTARRVAERASTSVPAVYELFGDKGGLVRAVFFEGFRRLGGRFEELTESAEPRTDLDRMIETLRGFLNDSPALAEVMFSHPFAGFDPGPDEAAAGAMVRELIVGRVRRCVGAGRLAGDPVDIAHVVLALAQGLAVQESAGWLGSSAESVDRRWALAFSALFSGLGG